jgi:hypothetical protein
MLILDCDAISMAELNTLRDLVRDKLSESLHFPRLQTFIIELQWAETWRPIDLDWTSRAWTMEDGVDTEHPNEPRHTSA